MDTEKKEIAADMPQDKVRMCSPWMLYVKGVQALFAEDSGVRVEFDEDSTTLKLFVVNSFRAMALEALLPAEKTFGNVTLKITVIPGNETPTTAELYGLALSGNPVLKGIYPIADVFSNPFAYIVFEKKVVQYFIDDMSDMYGNRSTLYQTLADETFEKKDGVFFTTDIREGDHAE